ncbi:hypothetical protein HS088_TW03G00010 [Tripterygium wilfordii]|uniref:Protein PHLOEM PROTEIN 2-LIKE A10 n=1 Tax=Tripterygium wilfordii TaxID=458696 RepID=A0A7J7DTJ0_TRIWF|nr:protein PHLOEM PROTEIN 2-LIKE A10-like [Tripterygium wilfordii]KAF5749685.1 hypothetical protein HS088_TW03G00010 [Tripterygium wilfordii]
MDLQLLNKGFHYTLKRRKWLLLLASLGFTGYGAYKFYHSPSIALKRKRVLTLLGALISVAEALSHSAEARGVVSEDIKEFLGSDSDKIPASLKQISKIARSDDFSGSVVSVTRSLTVGILQAKERIDDGDVNASPSFLDQVLDKLFTSAGSGFASVFVGSFARNLVMALYSYGESSSTAIPSWVNIVCSNKSRELIGDWIQLFVSTAVGVYLDKTAGINTYDELFAGLTNPNHERKVREILIMICNRATETLVKTSHQVLFMSGNSDTNSSTASPCTTMDQENVTHDNDLLFGEEELSTNLKVRNSSNENAWISKVSSTLAVPRNRKLVLDVTGRVTFETVRSFLECSLEKLYDCITSFANVVQEAFAECGHGVVRFVTAKCSFLAGVCLSLCLHVLGGDWFSLPVLSC